MSILKGLIVIYKGWTCGCGYVNVTDVGNCGRCQIDRSIGEV